MFGLDGYATAYGLGLCSTLVVSALLGGCARIKGTALLIFAWIITLLIQRLAGENAVAMAFASIDVIMFFAFWAIAFHFNRAWAQVVAWLHAAMILTHALYMWRGAQGDFVYLSILAGLGYCAMCVIAFPPLWRKAVELFRAGAAHHAESVDLKRYFRGGDLPASTFYRHEDTPENGG